MRYLFTGRKSGHTFHTDSYKVLDNSGIEVAQITRSVPKRLGKTLTDRRK